MLSLQNLQYYTNNLWAKITEKFMTKDDALKGVLLDPQWELIDSVQNNNAITLPSLDTFDELYIVMDNGNSTVIHQTAIKKESLVSENENVTYREILLDTLYDAETYAIYYPDTNTILPSVCEGVAIDETTSITTTVYIKEYTGVDVSNLSANNISYNNEASELDVLNVQDAIDMLDGELDDVYSQLDSIAENLDGEFLTKENPAGTGSFSMNRNAESTVGNCSSVLGDSCIASAYTSHAEGYNTQATNNSAHSEGHYTVASGYGSHAEGQNTKAYASSSHAEGNFSTASGNASHAEGYNTLASNAYSHAEGVESQATGEYSHAEGYKTLSKGYGTHTEGNATEASGYYAHAEGDHTSAKSGYSHAEGYYTMASGEYQHVQGKYNIEDTTGTYAHIVGNGTSVSLRSNAHTLDWDGNAWYQGDISFGGDALATTSQTVKGAISEIVTTIGDIGVLLDIINGEVV